jgi:hypothetical protein
VDRDQRLPTDTLWRFLEEDEPGFRRMLVFEDPYARRDDSTFRERRHATPVAFMDDDVYQVIAREQRGDAIYLPVAEYAEGYLVLDRGLLQLA